MLRECAQSIFRLEITLKSRFLEENRKKIFEKNHVGGPPPRSRRAPKVILALNFAFRRRDEH